MLSIFFRTYLTWVSSNNSPVVLLNRRAIYSDDVWALCQQGWMMLNYFSFRYSLSTEDWDHCWSLVSKVCLTKSVHKVTSYRWLRTCTYCNTQMMHFKGFHTCWWFRALQKVGTSTSSIETVDYDTIVIWRALREWLTHQRMTLWSRYVVPKEEARGIFLPSLP